MTVEEFYNKFILVNTDKVIEQGITVLTIYEESLRTEPIAVCKYDKNKGLQVIKPLHLSNKQVDDETRHYILNANIKRLGLGDTHNLDVVINKN